jgi:O-antigen ligase
MRPSAALCWPWAALGWGAFIVLHGHAATVAFALPALLGGLLLAGLLGQVDFSRRPSALELGVLGFGLAWLIAAAFALDPQRALSLSVPSAIALVCALVLPRARARHPGETFETTVLALTVLGLGACLQVLLALPADRPEQLVDAVALPWLVVPNDLSWMGCLWPLWWRWSNAHNESAALRVSSVLALSVVLAAALIVLQSRLGLLVLVLAVSIELGSQLRQRRMAVVGAGAIALSVLLLSTWLVPGVFEKGLGSAGARLQLWQAAWGLFVEHPGLGVGPHGFVTAYPQALASSGLFQQGLIDPRLTPWPHSLPLEILCSGGLLLALASVMLIAVLCRALRGSLPAAVWGSFVLICLVEASTLRLWFWIWFVLIVLPPFSRRAFVPVRLTE